jgi:hypothetical protein
MTFCDWQRWCRTLLRNGACNPCIQTCGGWLYGSYPASHSAGRQLGPIIENHPLKLITNDCEMIQSGAKGYGYVPYLHTDVGDPWHNLLHQKFLQFDVSCRISWRDVFGKTQTFYVSLITDGNGDLVHEGARDVRRGKMLAHGLPDEAEPETQDD